MKKSAYIVAARMLGHGSLATPIRATLVVAEDMDRAADKAKLVFPADWEYAKAGEQLEYRTGRGRNTPKKMWLSISKVDWKTRYSPGTTLEDFARAYMEVHET